MLDVEQTFKGLAREFVEKQAELTALASQQKASAARLDDFLAKESAAQAALRRVNGELDEARAALAQARRDAAKIREAAVAERDRILAQAHDQASGYLQAVQGAITAAASTIPKSKEA
jgi:hypothetical protein